MISFVYFDLGGVVIKDFSQTNKWLALQRDLGVNEANQAQFNDLWQEYENEICLNRDVDTLIPLLKNQVGLPIAEGYSLLQDFVNRFESNPSIWPVIKKIQQTCRVGLLTNAYPRMFTTIQKARIMPPVKWDLIIDSSEVKLQKPDPKIFLLSQKKCGAPPNEILFVENSQIHLDVAKTLGWQTFLYNSTDYDQSSAKLMAYVNSC